jgi:hypothetical protein
MNLFRPWLLLIFITVSLASCEFSCSIGEKSEPKGKAKVQNDARIYNDIKVTAFKANLKRAYLLFEDGTRVPDDNFVDFSQPVKLVLDIDGGWVKENGRVFLGASEKVIDENGQVLLDAADLFSDYQEEGISPKDAERISIKASIRIVKPGAGPASFSVQFRVWDKKGDAYIEGSYMLFSK